MDDMTALGIDDVGDNDRLPLRPLGEHGRALWDRVLAEYKLDGSGEREILLLACESIDRAQSCAVVIAERGVLIEGRGGLRDNPAAKIELAARALAARLLGRLGLDATAGKTPGRPPSGLGLP